MNFTYDELALLNMIISDALLNGKVNFDETSESIHKKVANELCRLAKMDSVTNKKVPARQRDAGREDRIRKERAK